MKVAMFSTKPYEQETFAQSNKKHQLSYFDYPLNETTVDIIPDVKAVCVFVSDELNRECISKLAVKGVEIIALRCAGFDNVDLDACKDYKITVVRVPAYSPHAVAEHAMALLLTLVRKTHKAYNRVRDGNFALDNLMGFDLHKKTIGIIGLGKIGMIVTDICRGFGMKVLAYDPFIKECGKVKLVSFASLIKESHIISLHCPLTKDSYHLINQEAINNMQDGVVLINTGRGALIDTKALIENLKSKKIGAVALDVYEQEQGLFFDDHSADIIQDDVLMRLMTFPNVLITSHQGFFTKEAMHEIALTTLKNITDLETSDTCVNKVLIP